MATDVVVVPVFVVVFVVVGDGEVVVVSVTLVVAGGAAGVTVVVTVDVDVDVDVEAVAFVGAAITPHATRLPASPVARVSWSGPGVPLTEYRGGMLAKLSAFSWMISAVPSAPRRSAAVNALVVVTSFAEPSERT